MKMEEGRWKMEEKNKQGVTKEITDLLFGAQFYPVPFLKNLQMWTEPYNSPSRPAGSPALQIF